MSVNYRKWYLGGLTNKVRQKAIELRGPYIYLPTTFEQAEKLVRFEEQRWWPLQSVSCWVQADAVDTDINMYYIV